MLKRTCTDSCRILAALMLLAVGACSADKESADPPRAIAPSAEESVDPGNVSPPNLPKVPIVRNERGAIKDLTLAECKTDAGPQTVSGEMTSSAKVPVDYLVTVSWTTSAGDVMGRGFAVVQDIEPGATESFEISAKVKDGATQCVKGASYRPNRMIFHLLSRTPVRCERIPVPSDGERVGFPGS